MHSHDWLVAGAARFTPRDSESLAERMEMVLTDEALRPRLIAEASEHILSFDWGDVARRTAQVYAELVGAAAGLS